MELELSRPAFSRLHAYLQTAAPSGGVELTNHWAFYGTRNSIAMTPETLSVRFTAGAGFDEFFDLNFPADRLAERLGHAWKLWRGRNPRRRFATAFEAMPRDGAALDSRSAISKLGEPPTPHKLLAAYYANLIRPHLLAQREARYLEIGAGSGYLAALMHALHGFRVTIVDLPGIIPFSYLYLTRLFPRASVQLPHEVQSAGKFPADAELVFLTPDQTHLIPDRSVALAVNTASFGEMLPSQIARYFSLLRRALMPRGLFFTANRVEKTMSPAAAGPDGDTGQNIAVRFADYPWLSDDRDVFFGPSPFHALVQPQNPLLQRLCHLAPG